MERRNFLQGIALATLGPSLFRTAQAAQAGSMKDIEALQKNWRALLAANVKAPAPGEPLKLSDNEWRKRLAPAQFHVLREEGTERAGTSPLNAEKRAGVFACAGCDLPLFTSDMKYESGTGWPSFWQPIAPENVREIEDRLFGMVRTEVRCTLCDAHLGHVFDDGPKPTGLRYCMNTVALRFVPRAK